MKIKQIESFANRQVCIVRVTSEDGAVGYGQTAPFEADLTQMILHRQVAPLALDRPDDDFSLADTWADELMVEPLPVVKGQITVPQGPGWGVEISPDWLQQAGYMITK